MRAKTGIGPNRALRATANKNADGKPFVYDELLARMRAVLRRSNGPRHPRLTLRDLEIDLASRVVTLAGETVQLSAKECELLVALAEDPERVFKKKSSCATSGASGRWGVRARWTRTRAGFVGSSIAPPTPPMF